ncbi:hypothetical protein QUB08_17195 [Microcoleus sp. BR0-C5]|uniref:hypothetical protein n=1 Tax=Microcoleus sp. BR0-C5 TaxID=2818713 RepID=UPI002FCE8DE5
MKSDLGVYGQRYGIEAMFKDCKTGGYNLEGCQGLPDHLIANHDFNCFSYDWSLVTGKKNQFSGTKEICWSDSRDR